MYVYIYIYMFNTTDKHTLYFCFPQHIKSYTSHQVHHAIPVLYSDSAHYSSSHIHTCTTTRLFPHHIHNSPSSLFKCYSLLRLIALFLTAVLLPFLYTISPPHIHTCAHTTTLSTNTTHQVHSSNSVLYSDPAHYFSLLSCPSCARSLHA